MRPLARRKVLQVLGAPAVAPLLAGFHPAVPAQEGGWKPQFLEGSEVETVAQLADRIVPETDTPGARQALVHQYVDFVLARGEKQRQERFRQGLGLLDRQSRDSFGGPFAGLRSAQQDELLTRLSASAPGADAAGAAFFALAKELTVDGYYRSEAGLVQELGFQGRTFLADFKGCTHPEHQSWKVEP